MSLLAVAAQYLRPESQGPAIITSGVDPEETVLSPSLKPTQMCRQRDQEEFGLNK